MFIIDNATGQIVDSGDSLDQMYPSTSFTVITVSIPPGLLMPQWDNILSAWVEGLLPADVAVKLAEIAAVSLQAAADEYKHGVTPPNPQAAFENKTAEINRSFEDDFKASLAAYPHEEIETWVYQADEAWDIIDQKGKATPILDAIIAQTGENITLLANGIVAKEAAYKLVVGALVGKRHALINTLNLLDPASPTYEADVAAVVWV
ncbi:MAG: hypothetical protein R8M45_05730 [Ghiorsea sp.]